MYIIRNDNNNNTNQRIFKNKIKLSHSPHAITYLNISFYHIIFRFCIINE